MTVEGVVRSVPGVRFQVLDGGQAAGHEDDLLALRADAYGEPGGNGPAGGGESESGFPRKLRTWRRQPGFALATAHHGEYLVGYACGMPLRTSTDWWRGLTAPLPEHVTAEHPGRTFALLDLAVRASWRRQGVAWELCGLVLSDRTEERATLTIAPDARAAQQAFRNWGWRKVGRTRARDPETPVLDILVTGLQGEP
jgi:ribosomal protein S18 acetylase RimI-like enzyme